MTPSRILLIDDSPTIRAVMAAALRSAGYEVVEASDGEAALETIRSGGVGVALLDIEMPGLDGFEVLAHIRDDPELSRVPVIFLTGRADPEDVARGLREGAHDYLRKPAEQTELLARVHAALRTRALEDELRRRNEELDRIASTDHLTGISNRRVMTEELGRLVGASRRHDRPLSIALLDVDRFKKINDELGHETGDEVLVALAQRVSARLRTEDLFGRWGGEEFLVLMRETALEGAMVLAEALRSAIADTRITAGGGDLPITVSIGVAAWAGDDAEGLLRRADRALYDAKDAGRNTIKGSDA